MAAELGRFLEPLKGMCHVNIIPLNPTAGYDGGPSMAEAVEDFVSVLARYSVPATPRFVSRVSIKFELKVISARIVVVGGWLEKLTNPRPVVAGCFCAHCSAFYELDEYMFFSYNFGENQTKCARHAARTLTWLP